VGTSCRLKEVYWFAKTPSSHEPVCCSATHEQATMLKKGKDFWWRKSIEAIAKAKIGKEENKRWDERIMDPVSKEWRLKISAYTQAVSQGKRLPCQGGSHQCCQRLPWGLEVRSSDISKQEESTKMARILAVKTLTIQQVILQSIANDGNDKALKTWISCKEGTPRAPTLLLR